MNDVKTQSVGFLIFEGFPMACLTSMIEPLRAANEISGQEAFSWSLVAETMAKRRSSAGISFEPDLALSDLTRPDYLFLLSPPRAQFANAKAGFGALRALARHGAVLGGVSGGVFPLVRSGVMAVMWFRYIGAMMPPSVQNFRRFRPRIGSLKSQAAAIRPQGRPRPLICHCV